MDHTYKYTIYDANDNAFDGVITASSHEDGAMKIRKAYHEFSPWFEIASIDIERKDMSAQEA